MSCLVSPATQPHHGPTPYLVYICLSAIDTFLYLLWIREIYLLCQGKDHCTAELLFCLFEFSYSAFVELTTALLVWSYPNYFIGLSLGRHTSWTSYWQSPLRVFAELSKLLHLLDTGWVQVSIPTSLSLSMTDGLFMKEQWGFDLLLLCHL